jgi:hypothetical protein
MAKKNKLEIKTKKAIRDARVAIDRAVRVAKKLDKGVRKDAGALIGRLEKGVGKAAANVKTAKDKAPKDKAAKAKEPVQNPVKTAARVPTRTPARSAAAAGPTFRELRVQARAAGLSGYSRLNKVDLAARLSGK